LKQIAQGFFVIFPRRTLLETYARARMISRSSSVGSRTIGLSVVETTSTAALGFLGPARRIARHAR
jgi:hypothetical protein